MKRSLFRFARPEREIVDVPVHQSAPAIEPMTVERVRDDTGSRIEPPLDQTWSDGQKLAWQAATVTVDAGIQVRVHPAIVGGAYGWGPFYSVELPNSSQGPMTYREAWTLLNGIRSGAEAVRRQLEGGR